MIFINMKTAAGVETVDEFTTRKEAREMLAEYREAFGPLGGSLYLSSRSTREWAKVLVLILLVLAGCDSPTAPPPPTQPDLECEVTWGEGRYGIIVCKEVTP